MPESSGLVASLLTYLNFLDLYNILGLPEWLGSLTVDHLNFLDLYNILGLPEWLGSLTVDLFDLP